MRALSVDSSLKTVVGFGGRDSTGYLFCHDRLLPDFCGCRMPGDISALCPSSTYEVGLVPAMGK